MIPDEASLRQHLVTVANARRRRSESFRRFRNAAINGNWDEYDRLLNAEYEAATQGEMGDGPGEAASPGESPAGGIYSEGDGI